MKHKQRSNANVSRDMLGKSSLARHGFQALKQSLPLLAHVTTRFDVYLYTTM